MPAPRVLLAALVAASLAATAATFAPEAFGRTFSASADAYVKSSRPAVNFGGRRFVRAGGRHALRGYVRFRVRTLDPIAYARLHLFVVRGSAPRVVATRVSNRWHEARITWSRQPRLVGHHVSRGGPARRGRWVEIDVSSIVKRAGTYSFRLSARRARIALWSRKGDGRGLHARKGGSKNPRLEITTAPVNTQPPQISGSPALGNALSTTSGNWRGSTPMNLAYEWRRCNGEVCSSVAAATTSTYALSSEDLGAKIQVSVTASNSAGFTTATSIETPVVTSATSLPAASPIWSADHETGDMSQWPKATVGWDSGECLFHGVSQEVAHSGFWSMKTTIDTRNGVSGCRQARLKEIQTGGSFVYEARYFLPGPVLTVNDHWNVFQFKSKTSALVSGSDPMWMIDFQGDPLRPVLSWKGGNYGLAGPLADSGLKSNLDYPNNVTTVPFGQWTTLTVYLDQSSAFDGTIKVWHDGTLIYDLHDVRTEYPSDIAQWSVNNYSNGLTVNPYTLYIDDVAIYAP